MHINQVSNFYVSREELFQKSWFTADSILSSSNIAPWSLWKIGRQVLNQDIPFNFDTDWQAFAGYEAIIKKALSDEIFNPKKLISKDLKSLLRIIPPDVALAYLATHLLCRRLRKHPLKKIWTPLLEDALLRARIGYEVGKEASSFGAGRGFLAGFAGRIGLIVIIATGGHQRAARTLQLLAEGHTITSAGSDIYSCDPLHVSSQIMIRVGAGLDAANGIMSFSDSLAVPSNNYQKKWASMFSIIEYARSKQWGKIDSAILSKLDYSESIKVDSLRASVRSIIRNGHDLEWLM